MRPLSIAQQLPRKFIPKENCAVPHRCSNLGGGINVARAIAHLGGTATAIFLAGGATGEHLVSLLADENVPVATVEAKDWTWQNLHVHVEASGEQYRFVMPGAALNEDEFRQLEEQVLEIESGAILVISGSLPPGVKLEKLTQLISAAQKQGIRCIVDSSGEALSAALAIGNIELVKPNQKELSALVNRELTQPDDVRKAAQEIVNSGKAKRVVVSWVHKERWVLIVKTVFRWCHHR